MNSDQLGTFVRFFLYLLGISLGWAGVVTKEQWAEISVELVGPLMSAVGGCITLATLYWAWRARGTPQMTAALNERSMSPSEVSNLADVVSLKPGVKEVAVTPQIKAKAKSVSVVIR